MSRVHTFLWEGIIEQQYQVNMANCNDRKIVLFSYSLFAIGGCRNPVISSRFHVKNAYHDQMDLVLRPIIAALQFYRY
jgi:hypothetical protein